MIAVLILVFSVAALLQFFIFYCRSVVLAYATVEVSAQARELAGLVERATRGDEFPRLVQLAAMCPEPSGNRTEVLAVRAYYGLVSLLSVLRPLAPALHAWVERERAACAYFAAVALDRRMALPADSIT